MTRLNRISAFGVFGQNVSMAPEHPVVVITGPNEAGKTLRLRLPELATAEVKGGNFPLVSKAPDRFRVEANFDDGLSVVREVDRRGKHVLEVNGESGTIMDGQAVINEQLGEAFSWSLAELQGMTPAKQLRWLEDRILDAGARDLAGDLVQYRDRIHNLVDGYTVPEEVTREVLVSLLDKIDAVGKAANSEALRLGKVVDHDEIEARTRNLPTGTVETWRNRGQELTKEIGELREKRGSIEGQRSTRETLAKRAAELEATIAAGQQVDVAMLKRAADEMIGKCLAAIDEADVAVKAAMGDEKKTKKASVAAGDVYDAANVRYLRADGATGKAELLKRDLGSGECPTCNQAIPTEMVERIQAEYDAAVAELETAKKELAGAKTKRDAAARTWTAADKAAKDATKIRDALITDRDRAKDAGQRDLDDAQRLVKLAHDAADQLDKVREQIEAIPAALATTAIDEQLTGMEIERKEAQRNADTLSDDSAAVAERERHLVDLEKAKDRRSEARALISDLGSDGLLGRILSEAFGPLVEQVNAILEPVTGSRIWVESLGGFRWGYSRGTSVEFRVPIETASESHQAVAMTAFGIVVRATLGGWKFVALDGIEVMGHERRTAFIEQMVRVCDEGLLDGFWCASVTDGWTPPAGCHHEKLGG